MCEQNREVLTTFGISERDVMQRLSEGKRVVLSPTSFIDPNDETLFKKSNRPKRFGIVCDTNNARSMLPLLSKTDLLIHEATIAPLQQELQNKTMEMVEKTVREGGHSTAKMAGEFARECEAKKLVLTHISSRYPANTRRFDCPEMREMRELAAKSFQSDSVIVANDFLSLSLLFLCCTNTSTQLFSLMNAPQSYISRAITTHHFAIEKCNC